MNLQQNLQISDAAVQQLLKILSEHPGHFLRIVVEPGGCSGFEYNLFLSKIRDEDDVNMSSRPEVTIIVDKTSLNFIQGSTLDYVEDLIGSAFKLSNPNASTSCGCGNSFSM